MVQSQLEGMKSLTGKFNRQFAAAAVRGITQHRMIHVRAMHPDLMGAAGIKLEAQQRIIAKSLLKAGGAPILVQMLPRGGAAAVLSSLDLLAP